MNEAMLWITFIGMILIPIVGGLYNLAIGRRLNKLEKTDEEETKKFKEYQLCIMCNQRHALEGANNDEKFKSLLSIMNTQFANLEKKVDGIFEKLDKK